MFCYRMNTQALQCKWEQIALQVHIKPTTCHQCFSTVWKSVKLDSYFKGLDIQECKRIFLCKEIIS